ncbi:MAG: clostripain-related cysteine peptidase [Candidatus Sericytochromatia bacterium]
MRHRALTPLLALALLGCPAPQATTPAAHTAKEGAIHHPEAAGPTGTPGKTLLAIYMIGSDLEDDVAPRDGVPDEQALGAPSGKGAGSDDMREILEGVAGLTEAEKANVDVVVAFGGSRKAGWEGVRYADLPVLLKDAEDGRFGNAEGYLHHAPAADMANGETLEHFLGFVQARRAGAQRVIVDFWDHGYAYEGMGPDTHSGLHLTLPAIKTALADTGFKADIVGFDACLMASVEVAAAVAGHFDYMVASTELEPGHGWDYTPNVTFLGRRPDATTVEIGMTMVDHFIDSPRHRRTYGKTLSLVNLHRLPPVTQAMDQLAGTLATDVAGSYPQVLEAVGGSRAYGAGGKNRPYTVDARQFGTRLAEAMPAEAASGKALEAAVDGCVVYSRDDGSRQSGFGLSMFSIDNLAFYAAERYSRQSASSDAWFGYVETFMRRGTEDKTPPTLGEAAPVTWRGQSGHRLPVSDDLGLVEVSAMRMGFTDQSIRLVAQEPLEEMEPNVYFVPAWDGTGLVLEGQGGEVTVPALFYERSRGGDVVYVAASRWNDREALLFMRVTSDRQVAKAWLVPYETDAEGEVRMMKGQHELQAGDRLSFALSELRFDAEELTETYGATITLGAAPRFAWKPVSGETGALVYAEDMGENTEFAVLPAGQ